MTTHVFSGNPLDRGDVQRRDEDWLRQAARDPRSRFLPLWQLDLLLRNGSRAELGWVEPADIQRLGLDGPPVFLGLMDGAAHFAVDVSALSEPLRNLNLEEPWSFVEARAAAAQLTPQDVGILAQSKAQVDWHRRHRFCGLCGGPTEQGRGGQVRKCTACNTEHFPRTDPVAIMVITDGERALLGQSRGRLARSGRYSALAGFIDQAECIEEAVRREVKEGSRHRGRRGALSLLPTLALPLVLDDRLPRQGPDHRHRQGRRGDDRRAVVHTGGRGVGPGRREPEPARPGPGSHRPPSHQGPGRRGGWSSSSPYHRQRGASAGGFETRPYKSSRLANDDTTVLRILTNVFGEQGTRSLRRRKTNV